MQTCWVEKAKKSAFLSNMGTGKKCGLSLTTYVPFNPGRLYGADDFLPVLTYVLAQCDMLELDTEIEYMMELLDPSLLHGEGNLFIFTRTA